MKFYFFFFGFFIGCILNFSWYILNLEMNISKYKLKVEWLEHYHWSLILATLKIPFCVGIATVLLIDEALLQERPFAWDSNHFWQSTLIGLVLFIIFLLSGVN